MSKKHDPQEFGFETWLECYRFLERQGVNCEDILIFEWEEKDQIKPVKSNLYEIKAGAFDEIYCQLPGTESIEVILELLKNTTPLTWTEKEMITSFFNRIPSRQLIPAQND